MITPSDLSLPPRFTSFRPHQAETILSLASDPKRFIGLAAPTGSGKSLTYLSYAILTGARVLILVGTKSLEDQILHDAAPMGGFDIRGHSNYPCAHRSYDDITGEFSEFECRAKREGRDCQWQTDINIAKSRPIVTSNYANWFQFMKVGDPDRLGKFDLLVIDEADTVHSSLVEHVSISLFDRIVTRFTDQIPMVADSLSAWLAWSAELLPKVERALEDMTFASAPKKEIFPVDHLAKSLRRILSEIKSDPSAWRVVAGDKPHSVKFSPVWGSNHAERFLFRGIEKVLLVSATLSHANFRQLGVGENGYSFMEVPSCFPVERRPFYYLPTAFVSYKLDEGGLRQLISRMDAIIARRPGLRGIIHTVSYDWAEKIYVRSKHRESMTLHRKGMNAAELIERFKRDRPSVLLSPVVEQGYNFPDNDCRYQFLFKLPRIDARDPLIKARSESDPLYLDQLMGDRIQQIYGRPTRSETDWSETFIFDKYWGGGNRPFRQRGEFRDWFRAAWKDVYSIPEALRFE